MREKFSCFYNDESQNYLKPIWESNNTLFIFDTNVLIDLYSFQPESRDDFFKVLDKLRDRIWLPYHVGLEYQRRRLEIIKIRREHFTKINKEIDELQHALDFEQKRFTTLTTQLITKKAYPKLYEKINSVADIFSKEVDVLKQKLKKELERLKDEIKDYDKDRIFLTTEDHVRNKIDEYFSIDKVGQCLFENQDQIDTFNLKGEERFRNKVPPGYEDETDKGESIFSFNGLNYKRKFGDLIIFSEMIEIAKLKEIKNIIFISGDKKSDWRIIEKLEGDKVLGARSELKMEMKVKANVENFYIFQVEEFLNKTKEILDIAISDESLTDIKKSLNANRFKIKFDKKYLDKNSDFENQINTFFVKGKKDIDPSIVEMIDKAAMYNKAEKFFLDSYQKESRNYKENRKQIIRQNIDYLENNKNFLFASLQQLQAEILHLKNENPENQQKLEEIKKQIEATEMQMQALRSELWLLDQSE